MKLYSFVGDYQHSRGTLCLHLLHNDGFCRSLPTRLYDIIAQKMIPKEQYPLAVKSSDPDLTEPKAISETLNKTGESSLLKTEEKVLKQNILHHYATS